MIILKNAVVMKLALGVLGVLLGVGGVAAGASYHASHAVNQNHRRLIVGRIVSHDGLTLIIRTRGGQTFTVHLVPKTVIRQRGKPAPVAHLQPGATVLVQVVRTPKGALFAVHISILKIAPTASGP